MARSPLAISFVLCALLFVAGASRLPSVDEAITAVGDWRDCLKQDDATTCDLKAECVWCAGKVATGCYPIKTAKLLPKKLYTCDKVIPKLDLTFPMKAPVNAECDASTEATCITPCVWCKSAAVPSGCFTEKQAKLLPSAVFACKFAPSA